MAAGIFKQAIDAMIGDLNFAIAYLDNIGIKRKTRKQHSEHIDNVFKTFGDFGIKLSEEKCDVFTKKNKSLRSYNRGKW